MENWSKDEQEYTNTPAPQPKSQPISFLPDSFDRQMGQLHGLPGVVHTKSTNIRWVTPTTGESVMFVVTTYREQLPAKTKKGEDVTKGADTIFLEFVNREGTTRIAIPPTVANAIARQRESVAAQARSKAAKAKAQARMERGELPGFMKGKKAKTAV